jgi:predicted ArsR family transcriptional regulator
MDDTEGTKTTRQRVLDTLLKQQRCTINELADAVEINPISVRHHITRLEAEGLVTSAEERHGVGRPRRTYFLTEKGMERFPTRYMRLTMRLLEQMKGSLPSTMVESLFSQMARDVFAGYQGELEGLSMDQRLAVLKEMLSNEGFNIEWELDGDQYHIRETNCPYYHVGQNHPEVCSVDQTLISSVLALPAEKVKCILHGDQTCTYVVPSKYIQIKEPGS